MKHLHHIATVLAALFLTAIPLHAQETRRTPQATRGERTEKKENTLPDLSVRAQDRNERLTQEIGNARWMRTIYRQIDLMKEKNAPLYYPVRPMNGQKNLFSTIFQLLCENKIKTYEYLDGYEAFDDSHLTNFKDLLDRFYILYEEIPGRGGAEPTYVINESDVPSAEVRSYYIKEAWYFDQNNSNFDVKILAICPILTSTSDMGETTMPMFWLPYETIRPYISHTQIMTSNTNNAMTFKVDDYFRRRMFEGEIIKTQNLMNQPLQAYCPTPDSLANEQKRIEGELTGFEKSLWFQPDTTQALMEGKSAKTKQKTASSRSVRPSSAKGNSVKTSTPKVEKSAPVRSVRHRR